jgi:alkylated DNA repair dioxygenase AlkB
MPTDFDAADKTFSELKRLVSADPFESFRLRVDGEEISVDHPNCIAFHPEVPYVTVHTRTDIYRIAVKDVALVRESYAS